MAFGSEVGTGHVSIFPSMKGFRSAVDKEMRGAGKSGSNRFSQAFGNGSKIGKSFGGSFKKAFGSSARGVADDVLKPLKRDAAQASSKASAALLNYRQATVNVQQAQERLNSAIARYGSDSTQAQTASINLEKAQLRQATALDKSNDAAERLADAKKALKAAEDELAKGTNTVSGSMKTMASSFSAGFSSISRGQSTFTGLSGALGSLVRSLLGVDAIWKPLGSKIAGFANKAISSLSGFAVQVGAKIQTGLKGAISAAQQTLKGWGSSIAATVSGIAKPIGAAITAWTQPIRDWGSRTGNTIKTAVATWTAPIRSFGGKIGSAIGDAAGKVGQKLAPVANVAKNYFGNIATAAGAVWSKLPAGAQTAAGAIGSTLGNLASSAGNSFKNLAQNAVAHIKGLATGAVAAIGAGVAAIGGTLVATGKQALGAYATWEQAVGGVDTLFKGASGTVQKYAAEAYKTAGVSANEYMTQVTSFSASLISSLGGDTAKAAELGNTAMVDMSDNANKMGTDIQTIQQTYQSLARGNYAMLDNLKLGYGGTKAEMERMIADANKVKQANGEMADLSVDKFADVVEAIHIVQTQLGISGISAEEAAELVASGTMTQEEAFARMGTTAKEAATTIEGSVGMMKAAWQNWLAELGKDNADMAGLSKQLVDSVVQAAKNIVPRIGQIFKGVAAAIPDVFDSLVTTLPAPFQQAVNAISEVLNNVKSILAPLTAAFLTLGVGGLAPLAANLPIVGGLFGGLVNEGSKLAKVFGVMTGPIGMVVAAIGALIATVPELRNAFGTQVTGAFNLFKNTIAGMKPTFDAFGKSLQDMFNQVMPVITASVAELIPVFGDILQSLAPLIPTIIEPLMNALSSLMPLIGQLVSSLLPPLADIIAALLPVASQIVSMIGQVISQLASALVPVIQQVMDFVSQLVTAITPLIQQLVPVITDAVSGITGIIQQLMPVIQSIISVVGSVVSAIIGFITGTLLPAVQAMLPYVSGVIDGIQGVIQGVVGVISGVISMVTNLINGNWSGAWNSFKSILSNAAGAVGGLVSGIVSAIKGVFAGAGSLLYNAGSQLISGLWNGISGAIGGLYDKIKGALSGLVDKAKEALGIHSPSRVFRDEVGRYIPPGISEGIDKATPALQRDIAKRMQGVTAAAQSAFQPMTLRSAIGVEGSAPLPETGNGLADLASMLVELRGLRSDLQALHGDLGPIIAKYTPSMTIREEKRRLGLV